MRWFVFLLAITHSFGAYASGGFNWIDSILNSFHLHLPNHTATLIFGSLLFLVGGVVYRLKTKSVEDSVVPDKGISFRNIIEAVGEAFYNLSKETMGEKDTKKYYPLIIFYFLFIFLNNLIGLIPGFLPPTENFNTGFALGVLVFIFYNYQGIRVQGLWGHIKHFMGPVMFMAPVIFVIEIISHSLRPIVLGLRIKGNMMGDHIVLSTFSELVPWVVPIPFYVLGIFVCFMQAFVFTLLTMVYIAMAVEVHDHEHAH
jgi:F-type H+-transporting ATPase subunit a